MYDFKNLDAVQKVAKSWLSYTWLRAKQAALAKKFLKSYIRYHDDDLSLEETKYESFIQYALIKLNLN